MEDSLSDSEIEDNLLVAAKNWNRIIDAAKKTGYREGIEHGSESAFQQGFDEGYKDGFKIAFLLGKFKSLINNTATNAELPFDIKEILDKTRRGECYLCKLESENTQKDIQNKPYSQIVSAQKMHLNKVIERLYQHFQPIIKQLNIDDSDLLDIQNHTQETPENKTI